HAPDRPLQQPPTPDPLAADDPLTRGSLRQRGRRDRANHETHENTKATKTNHFVFFVLVLFVISRLSSSHSRPPATVYFGMLFDRGGGYEMLDGGCSRRRARS